MLEQRLAKTDLTREESLELAILDYLLRRGYYETGKLYTKQVPWLAMFND